MATPYVPLLLPIHEVKMLIELTDYAMHLLPQSTQPALAAHVSAHLAEIKHKLDDALKRLKEVQ